MCHAAGRACSLSLWGLPAQQLPTGGRIGNGEGRERRGREGRGFQVLRKSTAFLHATSMPFIHSKAAGASCKAKQASRAKTKAKMEQLNVTRREWQGRRLRLLRQCWAGRNLTDLNDRIVGLEQLSMPLKFQRAAGLPAAQGYDA